MKWDNLVGRPFVFGTQDCFALAREFYAQNFSIDVTDYARPQDWSADHIDLIEAGYEREGFEKITQWRAKDLRPGDILCIGIGASAPNHFAVYVGDNKLLHHMTNRLSVVEPYRDFWRNHTCYLLRHPNVPDLRPVHGDKSIVEIIRERFAGFSDPSGDTGTLRVDRLRQACGDQEHAPGTNTGVSDGSTGTA